MKLPFQFARLHGGALAAVVGMLLLFGCSVGEPVERVEWPAMGTVAAIQWRGAATPAVQAAREAVQAAFARVEKLLSRFDEASELSQLADQTDAEILAACDPLVRPCYAAAFRLRDETDSRFNPRFRGPKTLDLGAIAKGFAVDLAAEKIAQLAPHTPLLVDLGGNLRAVGGDWRVGIRGGESFVLRAGEACATSGEYFRGKHIRDGRTGREIAAPVYSVTVVHPASAMLADGLSTVAFLLGREAGERFMAGRYPEAWINWIEK